MPLNCAASGSYKMAQYVCCVTALSARLLHVIIAGERCSLKLYTYTLPLRWGSEFDLLFELDVFEGL